jgi:hypothetical protein
VEYDLTPLWRWVAEKVGAFGAARARFDQARVEEAA